MATCSSCLWFGAPCNYCLNVMRPQVLQTMYQGWLHCRIVGQWPDRNEWIEVVWNAE